ncbi:MAG: gluconate 2-dehydrogenase subunit 3 family protein [Saprospiraceae bacterium]|nr:gluconate 2-dehydrogenase subunit 3 family protein [Saprospiraceae bacterium]
MKRRESLKTLALGGLSAAALVQSCKVEDKKVDTNVATDGDLMKAAGPARQPEELARYKEVISKTFFTADEMATIAILSDIIIPKDESSGSATEAGVPDFIEFIVKDQPNHQVPMRGGLRWLDLQCLRQYQKPFKDCTAAQQLELVDQIAYPAKAKPAMSQGVSFFNLMRNLTATGFYTSAMGVKDLQYKGNVPNQWAGVPDEVLKAHGLAYTDKELKECI